MQAVPFYAALIFGLVLVLSISVDVFNQPSYSRKPGKPYTRIKPKFITFRKKYERALALYLVIIALLYFMITFFPGVLTALGVAATSVKQLSDSPTWPLAAVSFVVGIQSLFYIRKIEELCRLRLHKWAKIPDGASETIDKLKRAGFNFELYNTSEILRNREFDNVDPNDFKEERTSIENRWARICCVMFNLKMSLESDVCTPGGFGPGCYDSNFFEEYDEEYQEIDALRRNLSHSISIYRKMKAGQDTINRTGYQALEDSLEKDLQGLLERIYTLIACAVRSKQSTDSEVFASLSQLGFSLPSGKQRPVDLETLIAVLGLAAVMILISVLAGEQFFPMLLKPDLLEKADYMKGGAVIATIWAVCAVLCHGSAAWVALVSRKNKISRGVWKTPNGAGSRPLHHYLLSAFSGGLIGYIILMGIVFLASIIELYFVDPGKAFGVIALGKRMLENLIWIVAFACTAWFAVYHYDTYHAENVKIRYLPQIALQASTMAVLGFFCALVYTEIWHPFNTGSIIQEFWRVRLVFSAFVAVILATMGGLMGFLFSKSTYLSYYKTVKIDCTDREMRVLQDRPIYEKGIKIGATGQWLTLYRRPYCLFVQCDEWGEKKQSKPFDLELESLKDDEVEVVLQPA